MGCGTGKLPQFGDPDEDKKQLAYRHSIRIFRFVFDHIDKLFQDNQIEKLIEEVEKTQLMMQQIIIDCFKATQSKEIFYNLADHMKQFISVENQQPLQLVQSAYIEEGEQDDERIKNALLSLEIGDNDKKKQIKIYFHEWISEIVKCVVHFQTLDHGFLKQEVLPVIENHFNELQFQLQYSYDLNEYNQFYVGQQK